MNKIISIFLFSFCIGCNEDFKISGVVVDKGSGLPLDSVEFTDLDKVQTKGPSHISGYTDRNGNFSLSINASELEKKAALPFIFHKDGYGSQTYFFTKEKLSDTIYMKAYEK